MEIAIAVGSTFLSSCFQLLFDKLASSDLIKFASKKNVLAELQKWEGRMIAIHAVLEDAEERQQKSRFVKKWLSDLRDLAFDVEDVLDLFAIKALRRKLKEESSASKNKSLKLFSAPFTKVKGDSSDFKFTVTKILPKINEITSRLEEVSNRIEVLGLKEIHGLRYSRMAESSSRLTTSLVCEAKVYGRDDDKKTILDMLKSETSNQGFSVISIVGMGGVGKTTLAKLVFNDGSVNFDLKAWVCVGENFDVLGITKTILQKFSEGKSYTGDDLDSLQTKLKEMLKGNKFLIVLDDVWNEDYLLWNLLSYAFEECIEGSKIIVTTRHVSVSQTMGSISMYTLPLLSDGACLSLLAQHALQAKNFDRHPALKDIGEEIAQRCKGLPLAAVIIGGLLVRQSRSHDNWKRVLGQWNSFKEDDGILSILKLSYHHLPSHLKRCFAYCAVFPKGYEIKKNVLIQLWMAEGLLSQSEGEKHNLGVEYFDELLSRSIFQRSSANESKYVMHDLVNDLACSIVGETSFNSDILKGNKLSTDFEKVRYLSLPSYDISRRCEMIKKMKHLRTLICLDSGDGLEDAMVRELRYLRALSLGALPSLIGELKLLRYIHLFDSSMEKLPESLGDLLGLQSLVLNSCLFLRELPTSIGKLVHLEYLDMSGCSSMEKLPESLGGLIGLQRLQRLILNLCKSLRELPTSIGKLVHLEYLDMSDCTSLKKLPESLGVLVNLQTLLLLGCKGLKELPTSIGNLEKLHCLDMRFCSSVENLPESLGSHVSLQTLLLSGCCGLKELPVSIGNLKNLHCLFMYLCTSVEKLPEQVGGLVNLQTLRLDWCSKLKVLPTSIGNLKKLHCLDITGTDSLREMPAGIGNLVCLQGLAKYVVGRGDNLRVGELKDLSHLQGELLIKGLHNVVDIQDAEKANLKGKYGLRVLNMSWVDDWYDERDEEMEMDVLRLLHPSEELENLKIEFYGGIGFPSWIADPLFGKLMELSLCDCKKIKSLPALGQLPSLKKLWIAGLGRVKSLGPEFYGDDSPCFKPFQSLECLSFVDMLGWEDWISAGRGFPRLRELTIRNCPKLSLEILDCPSLVPFPEGSLPPNLVSLEITGCQNLIKPMSEWGLDKLSSLAYLSIDGTCLPVDAVSFPGADGLLLPTSIICLQIGKVCKLESISRGLQCLISLKTLIICDCPELQSLPCEVLPSSLELLYVRDCAGLERKLQEERHKYPFIQIRNAMPLPFKFLHYATYLPAIQ